MMKIATFYLALVFLLASCERQDLEISELRLVQVTIGDTEISLSEPFSQDLPVDRSITLKFSSALDPATVTNAISLIGEDEMMNISTNLISNNSAITIHPVGTLKQNTQYRLVVSEQLRGAKGNQFSGEEVRFKTIVGGIQITSFAIKDAVEIRAGRVVDVPLDFSITLEFSAPIDRDSFREASRLLGKEAPQLQFTFEEGDRKAVVSGSAPLQYLSKYAFSLSDAFEGKDGEHFGGFERVFYSRIDATPKFPLISDEELLTKVQEQTFRYFWDFAHGNSGLARERNTSGNLVTIGGSGFGVMALIVGMERGFITRQQGVERLAKIVGFLEQADRFHGVWPHWLNGNTGEVIPFSARDNGGDLVETAFMIQGLLTARTYLNAGLPEEKVIMDKITRLWHEVEWGWYTRGGQDVLYWHWSPEFGWDMNLPIRGYNESLIVYVLAASSPTYPVHNAAYHNGWARGGNMVNGGTFFQYQLPLGEDFGGPLFFAHYSYLGMDPRNLADQYADYWEQNQNHTLINRAHCINNPLGYVGYGEDCWGLTASDNHEGYSAHSPTNDKGVITPTAALSSFPYTPEESMKALEFFYYQLGDRIWGEYGFYDGFNITEEWYADSYLAIDQGPIILMIENYRTGLIWKTFMEDPDVKSGFDKLGFTY
ncbi:glucoamylase family protein [Negadavirga shengliensis]|uniref:Glucoamylase family protein n=1 Tax=Negadavirga shengliensis TaxID=1389218 RepID=A0ABV9SX13_9BACT